MIRSTRSMTARAFFAASLSAVSGAAFACANASVVAAPPHTPQSADESLRRLPRALLRGEVFPRVHAEEPVVAEPARSYRVKDGAGLRDKLCSLEPGDRVTLEKGTYNGRFEITATSGCHDGTLTRPIQIVGEPGAIVRGAFRVGRSHWQFIGVEITPGRDIELPAILVESSHILLDRMHLHHAKFDGLVLNGRAQDVVVSRSTIHDFTRTDASGGPVDAHGIAIWAGASRIKIVDNEIHDNSGDGVQVNGPGDGSIAPENFARDVEIIGNRIHNDVENAVDIKDSRDVVIKDNEMWDYVPAPAANGHAISVAYDAANVTIAGNHIWRTRGVFVGRGTLGPEKKPSLARPKNVLIVDNYLENPVPEGVAFSVAGAQCVAIYHNVVRNFRGGVALYTGRADTARLRVANNIFLEISDLAFWLTPDYRLVVDVFDYNVFSSLGVVRGQVGGTAVNDAKHVFALQRHIGPGKRMPSTTVATNLHLENNDLDRITGLRRQRGGAAVHVASNCDLPALRNEDGEPPPLGVR